MKREYKQYQKYPLMKYRVAYAHGLTSGDESIVIIEKPDTEEIEAQYGRKHLEGLDMSWKITYACYWDNRLDLYRLANLLAKIDAENYEFYKNKCYENQLDYYSTPTSDDVICLEDQLPSVKRSYDVSESNFVTLTPSDYHRGIDLLKHGVLKFSKDAKGNLDAFAALDPENIDSRNLALAIAGLNVGIMEKDPLKSVFYTHDIFAGLQDN